MLLLLAIVLVGCNATGLPQPVATLIPASTPTTFVAPRSTVARPTPTAIAELPKVTPTARVKSFTPTAQPSDTPAGIVIEFATETSTAVATPEDTPQGDITPLSTDTPDEGESITVEPTVEAAPTADAAGALGSSTPTVLPQAERVRIFEDVWGKVNTNYLYKDFHGNDWNAIHAKYLPKVRDAANSQEFYTAIADMINALNDDHSRYLSPQEATEEDDLERGNANYVGIGILSSPDQNSVLIIYVFPNSPAEKAGLMRRDRITAVDGAALVDPRNSPSRIRGPKGTAVRLTVQSPEQPPREISIVRDTINGGILPTSSRLQNDPTIGYLVIPDLFTDNMGGQVEDQLTTLLGDSRPLKGIVMDLRGNGGGFRTVLESILGDFLSGDVGKFFSQKDMYSLTIAQRDLNSRLKGVPLVVLVDKGTESYAEVLSASLQERGRAKVVGVTTAGNTETIYRYNLEDGSRLWLAQEGFKLLDGTNLEGRGVIPNFVIAKDWTTFTERDDPDILKALDVLKGIRN